MWLEKIRDIFNRKLRLLEKTLAEARKAQKGAPSAMESHSDTTRSEMEKMVAALEVQVAKIKKYLFLIPGTLSKPSQVAMWGVVRVEDGGKQIGVAIVPDGMGGDFVDGVMLISETTPFGQGVLGIKQGEKFMVGEKSFKVISVD